MEVKEHINKQILILLCRIWYPIKYLYSTLPMPTVLCINYLWIVKMSLKPKQTLIPLIYYYLVKLNTYRIRLKLFNGHTYYLLQMQNAKNLHLFLSLETWMREKIFNIRVCFICSIKVYSQLLISMQIPI